jgi:hypothetical protein
MRTLPSRIALQKSVAVPRSSPGTVTEVVTSAGWVEVVELDPRKTGRRRCRRTPTNEAVIAARI